MVLEGIYQYFKKRVRVMQGLQNCERCGKVYKSNGFSRLCVSCWEYDELDFHKIKEYLSSNPGAKIFEVSSALSISVGKIKRYLRESRLEIIERENDFLFCDCCKKNIRSGKYCDDCYRNTQKTITVMYTGRQRNRRSTMVSFRSV
jgi:hypothetical protein